MVPVGWGEEKQLTPDERGPKDGLLQSPGSWSASKKVLASFCDLFMGRFVWGVVAEGIGTC